MSAWQFCCAHVDKDNGSIGKRLAEIRMNDHERCRVIITCKSMRQDYGQARFAEKGDFGFIASHIITIENNTEIITAELPGKVSSRIAPDKCQRQSIHLNPTLLCPLLHPGE